MKLSAFFVALFLTAATDVLAAPSYKCGDVGGRCYNNGCPPGLSKSPLMTVHCDGPAICCTFN